MKVIVKKPGLEPEICEVNGIVEINQLVGNVDENGIGYNCGGTDIRMHIGKQVDMYVKDDSANNFDYKPNLWSRNDSYVLHGTIVFAGYDKNIRDEDGACSLTDEQIDYCLKYIVKQKFEF